ncbi:hypothetical protein MRB53_017514 [Persea americana]|uniref:Uncharacterized protein n=1 Tax=Persea americana TaxID=3435 RepID=A0ACC2M587_PERAE|nr:hypothetical protein MRB53_017514 [Persea americana]
MAPIAVGEKIPDGTLAHFDAEDKLQRVSVHSLAAGKKVILFGVPGAFTPTCRHGQRLTLRTIMSSSLLMALRPTHALGLELDLSEKGLGTRSRMFALLVDNLEVKLANIEEGGAFRVSGAEEILKAL